MATFTNSATLSYNGNTVNSNTVTGNIVEVLSVTKTAVDTSYNANDALTYIISITNLGTTPVTGVTVSDNLGAYPFNGTTLTPLDYVDGSVLYYVNGVLQTAITPATVNPLTFSGITVPANGNVMLVYDATVNAFAPPDAQGSIQNEVTVNSTDITAPITANETVAVAEEADLSITKSLSPLNVTENSEITYSFIIQNVGNTQTIATDNVTVSDTFDPVLSNITVTLDGAVLPTTSYTYDETTGEFTTVPGAITVPAATFLQNALTGAYTVTPGVSVLTVTGTI